MTQIPTLSLAWKGQPSPSAPPGSNGFQGSGGLAPLVRKRRRPENPHDEVARPRPCRGGPGTLPRERASFLHPSCYSICVIVGICGFLALFALSVPSDFMLRLRDNQERILFFKIPFYSTGRKSFLAGDERGSTGKKKLSCGHALSHRDSKLERSQTPSQNTTPGHPNGMHI